MCKTDIVDQSSCPCTPQQNVTVERKNRYLLEVARTFLIHRKVLTVFGVIQFLPLAILLIVCHLLYLRVDNVASEIGKKRVEF